MTFKLVYLNTVSGELGRLPEFAIVDIGGAIGPTFTVGGKPLMFADGSTTDGSPSSLSLSLQGAYNNSGFPATINLTSGRDLVFNALNSKAFQFNAATGKVTITGDLEVLGSSSVIEGTISNVDQISISAPAGTISSLLIEPMPGVMMTSDLVKIQNQNGGLPVFVIDALGDTIIRTLNVGGIDFATFYNAFTSHIAVSGIKHAASQISVAALTNLPGTDVQSVLAAIDTFITGGGAGGGGSVTSVAVTSDDLTVTGSPITAAGTIALELNIVPLSKGGTGETTASAAINALVPDQTGQTGKVLSTNGTVVSWVTASTGGGGSAPGLFFTDVSATSTGNVGDKLYVSGTTPANKVIYQATTDTDSVTVTVFAEGDSAFFSPTITITTVPAQAGGPVIASVTEDPAHKRSYYGTAPLVGITANTTVTAVSSAGATATLLIQRAAVGPTLSSLIIGTLPGSQTEVKAGDTVVVTGAIQNAAVYAEIMAGGAAGVLVPMTLGALDSGGVGYRTLYAVLSIGNGTGVQTVQARGKTVLGTFGVPFTSSNNITLNQTYPAIGPRTIIYPVGQSAIKGAEAVTITSTISNFDTVLYTALNMSVFNPGIYSSAKVVTRTGGSYSYNAQNYTITANKASNNATSTASSAVTIADAAPQAAITIVGSPARLFSSPAGVDYTIILTTDQLLASAPTLSASSGTWQGSWTGAGTTWTRVLRIVDTNPKATQSFSAMSLTGLAGVTGTTITSGASYIVGGFTARVITFTAFERFHAIGTGIVDFSKVTALYTGSSVLTRRSDTNNVFQNFTIVNAAGVFDPVGSYIFISDLAFSGANTSGTLQLTVAEAA
jgi:hypothetical protein